MAEILICAPEQGLADRIAESVRRTGLQAAIVAAGPPALARLAVRPPELIVLDLEIDEGRGLELCRALREAPGGDLLPILLLGTGAEGVQSFGDALAEGADYYFPKPVDTGLLISKIQTYVGGSLEAVASGASPAPAAELAARVERMMDLGASFRGGLLEPPGGPDSQPPPIEPNVSGEAKPTPARSLAEELFADVSGEVDAYDPQAGLLPPSADGPEVRDEDARPGLLGASAPPAGEEDFRLAPIGDEEPVPPDEKTPDAGLKDFESSLMDEAAAAREADSLREAEAEIARLEKEAASLRREEEARERLRKEGEERERIRKEAEEKERLRKEAQERERLRRAAEERERLRREEEERERLRQEAEAAQARKQARARQVAEAEARRRAEADRRERERLRQEEEERARLRKEKEEQERLRREEEERARLRKEKEEQERLRREEEERERLRQEAEAAQARKQARARQVAEAEARRRAEADRREQERLRQEEEERARLRKEKEEQERLRREEEERERLRQEKEEQERLRQEAEERERLRQEAEAAQARKQARARQVAEAEARRRGEADRREEERLREEAEEQARLRAQERPPARPQDAGPPASSAAMEPAPETADDGRIVPDAIWAEALDGEEEPPLLEVEEAAIDLDTAVSTDEAEELARMASSWMEEKLSGERGASGRLRRPPTSVTRQPDPEATATEGEEGPSRTIAASEDLVRLLEREAALARERAAQSPDEPGTDRVVTQPELPPKPGSVPDQTAPFASEAPRTRVPEPSMPEAPGQPAIEVAAPSSEAPPARAPEPGSPEEAAPDGGFRKALRRVPEAAQSLSTGPGEERSADESPKITEMFLPAPPPAARAPEPEEAALDRERAPALLWRLFVQQVTGSVRFSSGGDVKEVFLERGVPVAIRSSQTADRFEELLYREGLIDREAYAEARVKGLAQARALAAHLVERGFLRPEELFPLVRRHLEECLFGLFEWTGGEARYQEKQARDQDKVRLARPLASLIMEGIRRKYLLPRMVHELGGPSSLLAPVPSGDRAPLAPDAAGLGLAAPEREVLRLVDGLRPIEEIVFLSGRDETAVYRVLLAGVVTGLLAVAVQGLPGPEASVQRDLDVRRRRLLAKFEQLNHASYFDILGVPAEATPYELQAAFERMRREFHPVHYAHPALRELGAKLDILRRTLDEAEDVLGDELLREGYRQSLKNR
jgi:CheY-like chemotaxis protein